MKQIVILLLLLTTTSASFKTNYRVGDETVLHYIYRLPKVQKTNPPLIILLHGLGSNERDLFSFESRLPADFLVVSARAPYEKGKDRYAWFDVDFSTGKPVVNKEMAEKSRTVLIKFISQLKKIHQFDSRQVYLCGFSQGAVMSFSVGLTRPDKIKGIAAMSGRLLDEVKPLIKDSTGLKKIKVFVSHGTNDNVLGIHYARESVAFMQGLGMRPLFKEYPEGHTISSAMLSDLVAWLKP